jgi:hypothetical protein
LYFFRQARAAPFALRGGAAKSSWFRGNQDRKGFRAALTKAKSSIAIAPPIRRMGSSVINVPSLGST